MQLTLLTGGQIFDQLGRGSTFDVKFVRGSVGGKLVECISGDKPLFAVSDMWASIRG